MTSPVPEGTDGPRPFDDLRPTGLLWLINRVVFHPRGFALALHYTEGQVTGWTLLGDGAEVWRFDGDEDQHFAAVSAVFMEATRRADEIERAARAARKETDDV